MSNFGRIRALLFSRLRKWLIDFAWYGQPGPTTPLAAMRIGIALVALVQSCAALPYLDDFVGQSAIIQPEVARFFVAPALPKIDRILGWLRTNGLSLEAASRTVWAAWIFLLLLLLAGYRTRVVAWLVWLSHLAIKSSGAAASYGVSEFLNILFFYTALGPAGEVWSIDALIRRRRRRWAWEAGLIQRVMRVHLCAVYLSSGVEKALGPEWWNGEALWRALSREGLGIPLTWLAIVPWILQAMGWWTVVVEIGYAPMILWRRTRWLWLTQIAMLHIGIAVFLKLWLFSAAMLLFNGAAMVPLLMMRRRSLRGYSLAAIRVRRPPQNRHHSIEFDRACKVGAQLEHPGSVGCKEATNLAANRFENK